MLRTVVALAALLILVHPLPAGAAAQYSFTPAEGPPGTTITLTGTVPASQRDSILKIHTLTLERSANGGIFQLSDDGEVTIDRTDHLTGTFHVPTRGDYDHGQPDTRFHPAMPGTYQAYFPCHACALAQTFVVTTSTSQLANTGSATRTLTLLACTLLVTGGISMTLGGIKRSEATFPDEVRVVSNPSSDNRSQIIQVLTRVRQHRPHDAHPR